MKLFPCFVEILQLIRYNHEYSVFFRHLGASFTNRDHDDGNLIFSVHQYLPPVEGRLCRYVGIKNGGATCYMNSVLQQLYMTPGVREVRYLPSTVYGLT